MRESRTPFVILGLLTTGPKTGYELKREIDEVIGHFWRESFGQIYPVLKRLTAEGSTERIDGGGPRNRQRYAITEAGRDRLRAWLEQPPEPEVPRVELLLKVFFGSNTRPEVLRSHVAGFAARIREFLALLETAERELAAAESDAPELAFWRLTVRSGRHVAEARLKWAKEADADLRALEAHD